MQHVQARWGAKSGGVGSGSRGCIMLQVESALQSAQTEPDHTALRTGTGLEQRDFTGNTKITTIQEKSHQRWP